MTISIYYNKSENYVLNKDIEEVLTIDITIKGECDILNPEIILDIGFDIDLTKCNYLYIPSFNRYYFIRVENIRNFVWRINGKVDVLCSWKEYIKACPALLNRYQNGEPLLIDDSVQVFSNPYVSVTEFSETFEGKQNYILTLIGKNPEVT